MKHAASSLQRPPTSSARTTNRQRLDRSARRRGRPAKSRGETRKLCRQPAGHLQGQPIRNDLKALVIDVVNHRVEIGQAGPRPRLCNTPGKTAHVGRQGLQTPEAPKKDDPEKARGGGELRAGGESGQNTASKGPLLRLQQRQRKKRRSSRAAVVRAAASVLARVPSANGRAGKPHRRRRQTAALASGPPIGGRC